MRRHNFQTVSWFFDLWNRDLLDLNPSYQRRSVWNQNFKDYFVDTVLMNYPAPAIFLYEDITPDGRSVYHVVDGKQRLTTLFEFVRGDFPVGDASDTQLHKGKYFSSLDDTTKKAFWGYQFLVEYVPSDDEKVINAIFDRINRNVSKLTPQELRHAKLDGEFIRTTEDLADWIAYELPKNFPRFASQSKKQMKDIEFVALLLLLLEEGAKSYSQDGLDEAFTSRDASWERRLEIESALRDAITFIKATLDAASPNADLTSTRLRNQADFYSLVGAINNLASSHQLVSARDAADRLIAFAARIEDETERSADAQLAAYYEAARSASNDKGPREVRIKYMTDLLRA